MPAKYNVGTVNFQVNFTGINTVMRQKDKLIGNFKKLKRQTDNTKKSTGLMSGAFNRLVFAIDPVRIAVNLARETIGKLINVSMEFEQQIHNVAAVAHATADGINDLADAAKTKSVAALGFNAIDASKALYDFASAGYDVQESISGLEGTLRLAAATQYDLENTTNTMISTMKIFGYETSQAEDIADIFAGTIADSMATMKKLHDSLAYVGPISRAAGLNLNELSSSLGVLYNAGYKASMAGTGLRRVLSGLIKETQQGTEILKKYGLTYEDINPNVNSMREVLSKLTPMVDEAGDLMQMFGLRGGPALAAMLKLGVGAYDDLMDATQRTGEATFQATMQLDTARGSVKKLGGELTKLGANIGSYVTPALQEAGDTLYYLTRALNRWIGSKKEAELSAKDLTEQIEVQSSVIKEELGLIGSEYSELKNIIDARARSIVVVDQLTERSRELNEQLEIFSAPAKPHEPMTTKIMRFFKSIEVRERLTDVTDLLTEAEENLVEVTEEETDAYNSMIKSQKEVIGTMIDWREIYRSVESAANRLNTTQEAVWAAVDRTGLSVREVANLTSMYGIEVEQLNPKLVEFYEFTQKGASGLVKQNGEISSSVSRWYEFADTIATVDMKLAKLIYKTLDDMVSTAADSIEAIAGIDTVMDDLSVDPLIREFGELADAAAYFQEKYTGSWTKMSDGVMAWQEDICGNMSLVEACIDGELYKASELEEKLLETFMNSGTSIDEFTDSLEHMGIVSSTAKGIVIDTLKDIAKEMIDSGDITSLEDINFLIEQLGITLTETQTGAISSLKEARDYVIHIAEASGRSLESLLGPEWKHLMEDIDVGVTEIFSNLNENLVRSANIHEESVSDYDEAWANFFSKWGLMYEEEFLRRLYESSDAFSIAEGGVATFTRDFCGNLQTASMCIDGQVVSLTDLQKQYEESFRSSGESLDHFVYAQARKLELSAEQIRALRRELKSVEKLSLGDLFSQMQGTTTDVSFADGMIQTITKSTPEALEAAEDLAERLGVKVSDIFCEVTGDSQAWECGANGLEKVKSEYEKAAEKLGEMTAEKFTIPFEEEGVGFTKEYAENFCNPGGWDEIIRCVEEGGRKVAKAFADEAAFDQYIKEQDFDALFKNALVSFEETDTGVVATYTNEVCGEFTKMYECIDGQLQKANTSVENFGDRLRDDLSNVLSNIGNTKDIEEQIKLYERALYAADAVFQRTYQSQAETIQEYYARFAGIIKNFAYMTTEEQVQAISVMRTRLRQELPGLYEELNNAAETGGNKWEEMWNAIREVTIIGVEKMENGVKLLKEGYCGTFDEIYECVDGQLEKISDSTEDFWQTQWNRIRDTKIINIVEDKVNGTVRVIKDGWCGNFEEIYECVDGQLKKITDSAGGTANSMEENLRSIINTINSLAGRKVYDFDTIFAGATEGAHELRELLLQLQSDLTSGAVTNLHIGGGLSPEMTDLIGGMTNLVGLTQPTMGTIGATTGTATTIYVQEGAIVIQGDITDSESARDLLKTALEELAMDAESESEWGVP